MPFDAMMASFSSGSASLVLDEDELLNDVNAPSTATSSASIAAIVPSLAIAPATAAIDCVPFPSWSSNAAAAEVPQLLEAPMLPPPPPPPPPPPRTTTTTTEAASAKKLRLDEEEEEVPVAIALPPLTTPARREMQPMRHKAYYLHPTSSTSTDQLALKLATQAARGVLRASPVSSFPLPSLADMRAYQLQCLEEFMSRYADFVHRVTGQEQEEEEEEERGKEYSL